MIKIVKESNIEVTDKASIISKFRRIITDIERRGELALDKYGLIDMNKFLAQSQFSKMGILNDTVTDLKNIETDIRRDGKAKIRSRLYADFLRDLGFDVTDDGNYAYIVENIKANSSKRNKFSRDKKRNIKESSGRFQYESVADVAIDIKNRIKAAYDLLDSGTEGLTEEDNKYIQRSIDLLTSAYNDCLDLCSELENYS